MSDGEWMDSGRNFGSMSDDFAAMVVTVGLCLAIGFLPSSAAGSPSTEVVINPHHQVLGELAPGEARTVVFTVENNGDANISLLDLATADEGMVLHSDDCEIAPGESGIITAMVTADRIVGPWWVRGKVVMRWKDSAGGFIDAAHPIAVSGFVNSAYDPVQPVLDLGVVDPQIGGAFEFHLASREVPKLEIRKIDLPKGFSVENIAVADDPQAVDLSVVVAAGMERGSLDADIVIHTNVDRQPTIRLACRGHVYGEIVPSPLPVRFWRSDGRILGTIRLQRRESQPVVVSSIVSSPPGMILLGQKQCGSAPVGCVEIEVSPRKMRPLAAQGTIDVSLDGRSTIEIPFVMKTSAPQGLRQLVPFLRQSELASHGGSENNGEGPTLRWEVDGDTGVFGYLIYRSRQATGPFVRLNSRMIPARGTNPGEEASYEFIDSSAREGVDYYYYVDSVLVEGSRKRLTGVAKKLFTMVNSTSGR